MPSIPMKNLACSAAMLCMQCLSTQRQCFSAPLANLEDCIYPGRDEGRTDLFVSLRQSLISDSSLSSSFQPQLQQTSPHNGGRVYLYFSAHISLGRLLYEASSNSKTAASGQPQLNDAVARVPQAFLGRPAEVRWNVSRLRTQL